MRVLWIASSKGLFESTSKNTYNGGGWVAGLQQALNMYGKGVDLGISFLTKDILPFKCERNGCVYYPVNFKMTFVEKVISRIRIKRKYIDKDVYLRIIDDFKPDIIHIFGVELPYSHLVDETRSAMVVHLQGFLNPYLNAYFPPGMNVFSLLRHSKSIKELIGLGFIHNYKIFRQDAKEEKIILSKCQNVMGRTVWDRQIADLMTNQAHYYHIDEVLRGVFYEAKKWQYHFNGVVCIVSTISPSMYKGLDLIFKTAKLLNNLGVKYSWEVIGLSQDSSFVRLFERQYGLDTKKLNLTLCGRQEAQEIIDKIRESDLYVHPSYIDNSPNSVCEAQLLGIPIVACHVGGVSSLIENEKTGFLIPANAPYELAYLIKHYAELPLTNISYNEIQVAEKRHNRKSIVEDLLMCYSECIKHFNT